MTPPVADDAPQAAAAESGLRPAEMVEHVLSRTTFGATPSDRDRIARIGIAAWLEEQLHPERIDDGALEARLARFDVLREDPGKLARKLLAQREARKREAMLDDAPPPPEGEADPPMRAPRVKREIAAQLAQAKVLRAVSSRRQLQEVMVDFWFNHFNVFAGKGGAAAFLPGYEQGVIRENALGSFPQLLLATARSPAMLVYLDNWRSSAPRPGEKRKRGLNENYARELLELHTLGVDGGYTQRDIVEVARCFTGWTIAEPWTDPHFAFRPGMHDFGSKVVLGHFLPAGRGVEDGEEVLRILAAHPSTARFIAEKLVRSFVSDEAPPALAERVAATYQGTRGDIRSLLRTIFQSPEFWSRAALGAKVRSPLELVAASLRALDATVDDPLPLARAVARIGEPFYGTRSHFDAQDALELGTPGVKGTADGWLARSLRESRPASRSPLEAVAASPRLPRSLQGAPAALAFTSIDQLRLHALAGSPERGKGRAESRAAFAAMYDAEADDPVGSSGKEAFAALELLESKAAVLTPAADYPRAPPAPSLRQLAQLIKADVGLRVGCVDATGWDTHTAQPGRLAASLRQLAGSLAAFQRDLGPHARDVVLVAATEFGRTVRQNGANGTDHGHGSVAFVLGEAVRGGAVLGRWPGLADDRLYEGRDLAVTTDLRSVLAAVAREQLGTGEIGRIFPGFAGPALPGLL